MLVLRGSDQSEIQMWAYFSSTDIVSHKGHVKKPIAPMSSMYLKVPLGHKQHFVNSKVNRLISITKENFQMTWTATVVNILGN